MSGRFSSEPLFGCPLRLGFSRVMSTVSFSVLTGHSVLRSLVDWCPGQVQGQSPQGKGSVPFLRGDAQWFQSSVLLSLLQLSSLFRSSAVLQSAGMGAFSSGLCLLAEVCLFLRSPLSGEF